METIKVNFDRFWPDFDPEDNYFTRILRKKYHVEISNDPDLYFFTYPYGGARGYLKHKCHRVYLGWENMRADWNIADYVLDSDFYVDNPRHKRWPIWAAWNLGPLLAPKKPEQFLEKKKFACMVVSNAQAKERIEFFHALSKYKTVDSGGRYLNNIGAPVADKMKFISDYKFVISFENSNYPGYSTEKLIEPMLVNSIPIYWGNREVGKDFNTESFIHVNEFSSYEKVIERIIELDQDDTQYCELVSQPWFKDNRPPEEFTAESMEAFFDFIVNDIKTSKPVATSFTRSSWHKLQLFKDQIQDSVYHRFGIVKHTKVNVSESGK